MEDYHHIDELIRQKFEGFEPMPPESVWEKVRSGLETGGPSPSGGNITLPILTGVIVLLGLLSMLFLVNRMESTLPGKPTTGQTLFHNSGDNGPVQDTHQIAGASFTSQNGYDLINPIDNTSRILTSPGIPVRKPFDGNTAYSPHDLPDTPSAKEMRTAKRPAGNKDIGLERFPSEPWRINAKTLEGVIDQPKGHEYYPAMRTGGATADHEDYAPSFRPNWSIGMYFSPEIAMYPQDDIPGVLNYSLQILPRVNFGKWYLQSGVGLRAGGDRGDYSINYNKFLGSYEDVYEVTFDTTAGGLVPVYHTQSVDVYDTVPYYSISETKATFAYLDVPLLIGREWNFKRLSLHLHAGPSVSLLLGRSAPQTDYPEENIRILNESPQVPAREQFNWQIMAGAGFSYSFTDKVSLSLEPSFRYYLSKDYEELQLNTRHPYSFGIRAGLIYHINH